MTVQAQIVLILWIPICILIFRSHTIPRAIAISGVIAALFLPQRTFFALPLFPNYETRTAIVYSLLIALFIYEPNWLKKIRFWWVDIFILCFCFSAFISGMTNNLGIYYGFEYTILRFWEYGIPYFIGRVYFNSFKEIKNIAIWIVKGAIIYTPFCIWEGLMSPQIHRMVYGFAAHTSGIRQQIRWAGYRQIVFMDHGLVTAFWMMNAALIVLWLWQSKSVKDIWGIKISYLVYILGFMVIWSRSTGSIVYFLFAIMVLLVAKWFKLNLPLFLFVAGIVSYLYLNIFGIFNKQPLLQFASNFFPQKRVASLEYRLDQEEILGDKARERFLFGWGGLGRNRVFEENGLGIFEDISVTDSVWMITFGNGGVVGIASFAAFVLLVPSLFIFIYYPVKTWFNPVIAPAVVLAVIVIIWMFDLLFNSPWNVLYPMIIGGLSGIMMNPQEDWRSWYKQKRDLAVKSY